MNAIEYSDEPKNILFTDRLVQKLGKEWNESQHKVVEYIK